MRRALDKSCVIDALRGTFLKGFLSTSIFVSCSALYACKPRTFNASTSSLPSEPQASSTSDLDARRYEVWNLMRAEHLKDIQPQCEPQRYLPPKGVSRRGLAILLHGYSACPDQYDVLGPKLAASGYEVLVPLFPGHGAKPLSMKPRKDDVEHVPRVGAGWGPFVSRVNELGSLFDGERVLVGLSHGSSLALRAIQKQPNLWGKAFLMAPKLTNETSFLKFMLSSPLHVLSINQLSESESMRTNPADYADQKLLSMRSGWRACSEVDVHPPANRGGFCNFENRHALAMFDFGETVIKSSEAMAKQGVPISTQVQFVLSEQDKGVCNNATQRVLTALVASGALAQGCIMPEVVPHSMISTHDSPYDKPWTRPLFESAVEFFTQSNFLVGSSATISSCQAQW